MGQPQLARALLSKFPSDGVDGETLQQVREMLANYDTADHQREDLLARVNAQVALVKDDNSRHLAEDFAKEIAADADSDALGRLASFDRLADAADLSAEQKVALAISGWLVGANEATDNFHNAVSLAEARDRVRKYLREPTAIERQQIVEGAARYGRGVGEADRADSEADEAAARCTEGGEEGAGVV